MKRLNSFQKDLLILVSLFLVHLMFTLVFPLRFSGVIEEAEVTSQWFGLRVENVASGETYTHVPALFVLYVLVLAVLILKKDKSLTLIYGFGLVLLAKFTYLSQLLDLRGAQESLRIDGALMRTVYVDGEVAAQDISLYVLLILIFIKSAIVVYQYVSKRLKKSALHKDAYQNHEETAQ